jgi:HEAT repeat protein
LALALALPRLTFAANHPIRTFTFDDRGPEIARLYRLGLENDPKNVPAFCEALGSEDLGVRKAAIAQLVFTHDESAFDAVAAALKDESSWVRRGAIAVLEKLGDPRAVPLLQEALTFVPPPPRRMAGPGQGRGAGAPAGMGPGPARGDGGEQNTVLRQEEYFNRMAVALALHRLGSDAGTATVLEILRGQHDKPVLQMAVRCVILMDLKQATPDLLKMAGDCVAFGEDTPGFFAIRALRIMGDPAYAGQMVELAKQKMDCPGGFIRMEALNLLMLHGDQSVMPTIRQVIESSTWREHARPIVETIRRLRPSDGAALLVKNYLVAGEVDPETGELAGRPNPHVFHFAVAGVAELGDNSVLEDLKASYKRFSEPRDNFNYRLDLAYAIAALGDGFGLDELHKALRHEDGAVRRMAAKSLGKLGSPASLAPLTAAFAAEGEPSTFLAMKAAVAKLGAPADLLARPAPPAPPVPADTYNKPRYLHVTFDDCTTVESTERFVGLMEELASQDVRWAPGMYVAALSRHDFEYVTMILQRCFDRGCEFENHSLHHNPDGQAVTARTADDVRLDCGGCTNWLHGNIMGCDRIYSWKSGGGGFRRPGDPTLSREELREVTREAFWAKNIDYSWRALEKAYPDYFAPPYHFLGQSPVESCRVAGDLSYDYEADTVEEGVNAFVESLDAWYFNQPETVFEVSGHDWPNSSIPIRIGHEMHWDILSGFLREVLLNRRDRYPLLYSMTALEVLHVNQRGLTPEDILTQTMHLQNSPEF